MDLATSRAAIAAALSTVPGLTISARPIKAPKAGDGWIVVNRVVPRTFTVSFVTFTAVVVLGTDSDSAEQAMEEMSVPLINASATLQVADVSLEPSAIPMGTASTPTYVLELTLTMEVD